MARFETEDLQFLLRKQFGGRVSAHTVARSDVNDMTGLQKMLKNDGITTDSITRVVDEVSHIIAAP